MGTHNGAVDHRVFVVGIDRQMLKHSLPDAGLGPAAETAVDVLPVAKVFRQVAPRNAGSVAVQHRFHEQAVIRRRHPDRTLPARQKVLDPVPLVITKPVAVHRSTPQS